MGRFGDSHFVHVTDGAPRNEQDSRAHGFRHLDDYRRARREEFDHMLERAGIPNASQECLGMPDQEASLQLAELTRRIVRLIAERRAEVIFTHPFEGGHPDHDACAFAVHHAVAASGDSVVIVEAPFYNAPHRGEFQFLTPAVPVEDVEYELTPAELERKHALIDCFTSQRQTLSGFNATTERYRLAPDYDFGAPAHHPPVLYDEYPWGMTSARFAELAREAEGELGTASAPRVRAPQQIQQESTR
jgi:LmbE family N-acetylglucosaminyl deacetylase